MTREEHIDEDRRNLYNKLSDIEMDETYYPDDIVEILKIHDLDNGIIQLRPNKAMTGHEIIESLVKMYTIIGDSIDRNIGMYN